MGGRADVHAGVVQHEVFEVHEFALEPQGGAAFRKMRPGEIQPSRTGLARSRSSRRASASSAWASGAASARQGIGSGNA